MKTLKNIGCMLFASLLLVAAGFILYPETNTANGAQSEYLYQITAYHGPFDEICLFRYYNSDTGTDDIPQSCDYSNARWRLVEITGPEATEFGPCWEARYEAL